MTSLSPALVAGAGTGSADDVVVSRDGRSLFVTMSSGVVAQYAIAADGTVSPRTPATVATGAGAAGIAVAPEPSVTPPAASIAVPADGAQIPESPAVDAQFSCYPGYGGPALASCTDQNGNLTGAPLDMSAGTHTLTITATSTSGLSSSETVHYTVSAPPDTTITAGPSGLTNNATPTFSFTSTQNGSTFQCRIDTAAFASCTAPFTTATLSDGAHTFYVRATNRGA